ncbi:MAG: hypothetical protein LAP87_05035 [Acidobacteriia bacterium]|nr:hypothetical protein [Terriglobia bacterium]
MKNFLFVTLGTSALDAPRRIPVVNPARRAELEPLAQRVREFKKDQSAGKEIEAEALFKPLLALHLGFWTQSSIPKDTESRRQTSAELLTTVVLLNQLAHDTDVFVDRVVLLIPETTEGMLSGRIVTKVMESPEYRGHGPIPEVRTRVIPGIAEKEKVPLLPGALLSAVDENRESEADRIIFNATAGYGAVQILIGMLALRYGFRIYYQHDSMPEPIFVSQNLDIGWSPRTWIVS